MRIVRLLVFGLVGAGALVSAEPGTSSESDEAVLQQWRHVAQSGVSDLRLELVGMLEWAAASVDSLEVIPWSLEIEQVGEEKRDAGGTPRFGIEFRAAGLALRIESVGLAYENWSEPDGWVRLLATGQLDADSADRVTLELELSEYTTKGSIRHEPTEAEAKWVQDSGESLPAGIEFTLRDDGAELYESHWFTGRDDLAIGTVERWEQSVRSREEIEQSTQRLVAALRRRAKRVIDAIRWD